MLVQGAWISAPAGAPARASGRAGASAGVVERGCAARRAVRGDRPASRIIALGTGQARGRELVDAARAARRGRWRTHRSRSDLPARGPRGASRPSAWGATRTTRSPRASRKHSSAPETWRQSSIAHTRWRVQVARPASSSIVKPARAASHRPLGEHSAGRRRRPRPACASACECPPRSRSYPRPSFHPRNDWIGRRTQLSRGDATLLSGHAGDPRTAAGDTTTGSGPRPTALQGSPPPARKPTRLDRTSPTAPNHKQQALTRTAAVPDDRSTHVHATQQHARAVSGAASRE